MARKPDNPHLAFPLRLTGAGNRLVAWEQDDDDDVIDKVDVLLRTPVDSREELPEYGVIPQEFSEGGADLEMYSSAVTRWEPRALKLFQRSPELLEGLIDRVRVYVKGRGNTNA